jgi:hypothetical protein
MVIAMDEQTAWATMARYRALRRPKVAGTCENCGTDFIKYAGAKYCSSRCRVAAKRERDRRARDEAVA